MAEEEALVSNTALKTFSFEYLANSNYIVKNLYLFSIIIHMYIFHVIDSVKIIKKI